MSCALESDAIFAPRAAVLSALRSFAAVKARLIPLGLLNCPHQIGLFYLTRPDVVFLGDFLDFFKFHDAVPSLLCSSQICVSFKSITHFGSISRTYVKIFPQEEIRFRGYAGTLLKKINPDQGISTIFPRVLASITAWWAFAASTRGSS